MLCCVNAQINETPDTPNATTFRFRFALPSASSVLGLPIGKHLVLRFKDADGRPVSRQYTPISPPQQPGAFELLIKLYPTGKMSQYLASLSVGAQVEVRGPMGMMEYQGQGALIINRGGWKERRVKRIGMIAGGTGLTPMWQVANAILADPKDTTELSLVYANVTEADILLRQQLDALAERHSNFRVFYTVNPPREGESIPAHWKGGVGFVSPAMITKHMPAPDDREALILLCGPKPMTDAMAKHLTDLSYSQEQFWSF